jgi:hypothetical protein
MGAPLCAAQHKDEHEAQTGMHAGMNTHASRVLFHTISAGPMGCSTGITPHEAINTVAAAAIAMANGGCDDSQSVVLARARSRKAKSMAPHNMSNVRKSSRVPLKRLLACKHGDLYFVHVN